MLIAVFAVFAFRAYAPASSTPKISDLVGDWSGTSLCQVKPSPCHDESVIFHLSNPHENKITIRADKIVDGKAVTMGVGDWTYEKSTGKLVWQIPRGTWMMVVSDNTMDGTLIVPENVVFRKIHLRKSK